MPSKPSGKAIAKGFFVFLFILAPFAIAPASSQPGPEATPGLRQPPEGSSAVVYVIDKSSSMRPIFDDLKVTLKRAVAKCGPDDSLSIILFGNTVTTLAQYSSLNESKKERISKLIDSVSADALYTNLNAALRLGTDHLHKFYSEQKADRYALVLVTDGKDHPSPDSVRDDTLEEALTQYPDFCPGEQWSVRYVALKGQVDPELLGLVKRFQGGLFDVEEIRADAEVSEVEVVGSILENPQKWEPLQPAIVDYAGEVKLGSSIIRNVPRNLRPGERVTTGPDSRAVVSLGSLGRLGLEQNSEVTLRKLERSPLTKSTEVRFILRGGTLWSVVDVPFGQSVNYEVAAPGTLVTVTGTVVRIGFNPETLHHHIAVVKGSAKITPNNETPGFRLWNGLYSESFPGTPFSKPRPIPEQTVYAVPLLKKVELGPVKPGQTFSAEGSIQLSETPRGIDFEWSRWMKILEEGSALADVDFGIPAISARAELDLPKGMELSVTVSETEDELRKDLLVLLKCTPSLKEVGFKDYAGGIELSCEAPHIRFTRANIDLLVLAPRPPYFIILAVVLGAIAAFTGVTAVVLRKYKRITQKWKGKIFKHLRRKFAKTRLIYLFSARPSGNLALRNPSGPGKNVFNLAKISRRTDKTILTIGSDPSNDIHLPHRSVEPFHCVVRASRKRHPSTVYIETLSRAPLIINDRPVRGARKLEDKDAITIGTYQFEYIDTQMRRQVEVHMSDGDVYEGIIEYWDLTQSVFYMTDTSAEEQRFRTIRFADVAYVHFYRDESEREVRILGGTRKPTAERKKIISITLANKQRLEGFAHRKYQSDPSRPGVVLFPLSPESLIQHTYIPRSSIISMAMQNPR